MEGHASWNDSFREPFELNQGSPDQLSTPSDRAQTNSGWEHGESSSNGNNMQGRMLGDNWKLNFAWYSSSSAPSVIDTSPEEGPPEPSTSMGTSYVGNQVRDRSHNILNNGSTSFPWNPRQGHMHSRENSDRIGPVGRRSLTIYESGSVGTEDIMVHDVSSSNQDDAAGPSYDMWGSSFKRISFEGSLGDFYTGGSSNPNQPMENVGQQPVPPRYAATRNLSISSGADHLEQLHSRSGVGTDRLCSGHFTSSSFHGSAQNSVSSSTFDASRGPFVGHSTIYASQPQSRPISNSNALESRSPMTQPFLNEPFVHVNEGGRTHLPPGDESFSFQHGSSSRSVFLSGERGHRAHDEVNFRSPGSNISGHPPINPAYDTINISVNQMGRSFTPGTSVNSRSNFSPWINPRSGGLSSSAAAWLPHGDQASQDWRRLFEEHQIPFPSIESDSGSQRSPFAPPHLASASSNERATSGPAQHHQSDGRLSSLSMDAWGDNTNRQDVLDRRNRGLRSAYMRRATLFHDEADMLFDPYANELADLQDRHVDMRLDVDNMSYEELLALEERIGNVNTGLGEEKISGSMKMHKYEAVEASQATEECSICQEEYVGGDDVGKLDCGHEFHYRCIKQWLTVKNICPICKKTALET